MHIACRFGAHAWRTRVTARPGVAVHRCARCDAFVRTTGGRGRRRKRAYLAAAALLSLLIWYVVVSLGLTGHTHIVRGARAVAGEVRRADHRIDRVLAPRDHAAPPPVTSAGRSPPTG